MDGTAGDETNRTQALLSTARRLVAEIRPQLSPGAIGLDSRLDVDLGLDSLAVIELAARLEDDLGVVVPEDVLVSAQTLRDLLCTLAARTPDHAGPTGDDAGAGRLVPSEVGAPPHDVRSLVEVLRWHAEHHADRVHLRILSESGRIEEVTYGQALDEAMAVAAALRQRGVGLGSSVSLMLPTSREYFTTFLGILLAGGVPVPVYPPARPSQLEEHLRRHVRILANAEAELLITVPEATRLSRLVAPQVPSLRAIVDPADLCGDVADSRPYTPGADDVALLQYTSGSTGDPKGVVLTHANLLSNIRAIGAAGQFGSTDVFVSWLPLYHDMGLIGAWLTSFWFAFPLVVMSPLRFLARPSRWLQAITDHGGTISGGPNFGFELCLRRIGDDELEAVDLRSWRIAFNGAEPVSPDTVERFAQRFAPYGLRPGAITPVYGLAESSVALAAPPLDRGVRIDRVAREPLTVQRRAIPAGDDDPDCVRLVACGKAVEGHRIRIVDDAGSVLPDRHEGLIQFQGPSATSGYHRNPDATRELFDGAWLRTGDLGYTADGDLFITGRRKDLIIRAGRNLHPAELEAAVGALPGVRKGCVAAFSSTDRRTGTERLIVVAETREGGEPARQQIRQAVVQTAVDLVGSPPDDVVVTGPGSVPKTSSGKIRRATTRERYESGTLQAGRTAVWRQVIRLGWRSTLARLRPRRGGVGDLVFGIRAWLAFAVLAAPGWVVVMLTPGLARRWRIVRALAGLFLHLSGIRVTVEGAEVLPGRGPYVVVANHASYADPLAILMAVPGPIVFAGVAGLARHRIVGPFVRRMGTHLVGSGDRREDAGAVSLFSEAIRSGQVVAFFPEGRRTTAPGLEPFRLGAFVVAAGGGVPVVPVTITGTRQLLPTDRAVPRRAAIRVRFSSPVEPEGNAWSDATRLAQVARAAVLQYLDEPDLS